MQLNDVQAKKAVPFPLGNRTAKQISQSLEAANNSRMGSAREGALSYPGNSEVQRTFRLLADVW